MKRLQGFPRSLRVHWRLWAQTCAALLVAVCLFKPELTLPRRVFRYLMVLDITQSMNTQDYHHQGMPPDRLGYAKESVRSALHALPCGSEVGLGLFTTQTVHFLFEPLEVCAHFSVIDDVLSHIDWRMAWSADSHVEMGLYHTIRELKKRDATTRLIFLTDGQETPPQSIRPQFNDKPGELTGAIIGVGGLSPVTVPRYDRENQLLGNWQNSDIEKPPISSTVYSEKVEEPRILPTEGPYLSWLDEAHLKHLSAATGLSYQRLDAPGPFVDYLNSAGLAELRPTVTDIRPWLGALALFILTIVHGVEKKSRLGRGRG